MKLTYSYNEVIEMLANISDELQEQLLQAIRESKYEKMEGLENAKEVIARAWTEVIHRI